MQQDNGDSWEVNITDIAIFIIYTKDSTRRRPNIYTSNNRHQHKQSNTIMEFRKATENDFPSIWEIILQAKQQMQAENRCQWNENYPIPATIYGDIEKGIGYVLEHEGQVIAYSAISFDEDPAYKSISGKWLTESPYIVIHRIAVSDTMKNKGIATKMLQEAEQLAVSNGIFSMRADTKYDNNQMLKVFQKLGMQYCGEVLMRGEPRKAFEKIIAPQR